MIQFDKVSFAYQGNEDRDSVKAVSDVSFTIPDGSHVVFLGRNGSGKSTVARLMNGLLLPDEGTVTVDGMDTSDDVFIDEIRRRAGMVFQNPDNQIIGTTVADDIAFGPCNLGLPAEEVRSRVKRAMEETGMSAFSDREPYALSGGQKQKLAVASVLAMHPKILILDESTAMLDPASRRALMDLILKLKEKKQLTIVHITHHMEEALLADRVYILDEGSIALEGTPAEVFDKKDRVLSLGLGLPTHIEIAHRIAYATSVPYQPEKVTSFDGAVQFVREALATFSDPVLIDGSPEGEALSGTSIRTENEFLHTKEQTAALSQRESSVESPVVIDVNHLSYAYAGLPGSHVQALQDASLEVRQGEVLGIVGHTGSGKSTLIQHFNGIIPSSRGTVLVLGVDLSERKIIRSIRRKVGLLFQYPEDQLFEETVALDIAFAPKQMGRSPEEVAHSVEKAAKRLGVDHVLDRSPFDLSGGQRRRVAIAGVLAAEPVILALDEPAAGLDPAGREDLFDDLATLTSEGATMIIVSHDMEAMAKRCDRILVMKEGRVAKIGTPEEIISSAAFLEDASLNVPPAKRFLDALADDFPGLAAFALDAKDTAEKILEAVCFSNNNEQIFLREARSAMNDQRSFSKNNESSSEVGSFPVNHDLPSHSPSSKNNASVLSNDALPIRQDIALSSRGNERLSDIDKRSIKQDRPSTEYASHNGTSYTKSKSCEKKEESSNG